MKKVINYFKKSEFINNFKILASGTLISQIIVIASSPFITRLYDPNIFGLFAIFMAFVSVLFPLSSGSYDKAIVVLKDNYEASKIFLFSIILSFFVSALILFIFFYFNENIKDIFNLHNLKFWFYLIPFAIFLRGTILAINSILNRYKDYKFLSKILIFRSSFNAILVLILGNLGLTFYGLFVGEIFTSILIILFIYFFYNNNTHIKFGNLKNYIDIFLSAKKYIRFPAILASATSLNVLRTMLPIFFLTKYYSSEYAGYFVLVLQVVNYPLSFISSSITTIQIKKVSELVNNSFQIGTYVLKIFLVLCFVIFFPAIILFFFGPQLFEFVFGDQWKLAGVFVQILIPSLIVTFVTAPLNSVLISTGYLKLNGFWFISSFLVIFLAFYIFAGKTNIYHMLEIFNICNIIIHLILGILIIYVTFKYSKNNKTNNKNKI